ncbi:MarR family transcriptional regulator [Winogradskyella maritima]|uniref:MarR family winged helix-turn-helix transcriptional regulator n=1 Tax=Winogradskyella maritima TaxID=1517766 RepID=A0ABV8AGF1_9FLAO|nr:MarR family transcriptional regulator [Winogradskyella maritima]
MKQLKDRLKLTSDINDSKSAVVHILFSNMGIKEALTEQLKPYDLSIEQFNVLRILRGQNGKPLNLQDINERMVAKSSNTTRLVDKLIDKSFTKRKPSKSNRRKVDVSITAKGLEVLKTLDPLIDKAEMKVTENLNDKEIRQLNKLLAKLNV